MSRRPALYILAGVNGAGKSSVDGYLLTQAGLAWFNPNTFARELMAAAGCTPDEANAVYDNSTEVAPGDSIPDPILVLETMSGKLVWPATLQDLQRTPEWAKAIVEAAIGA